MQIHTAAIFDLDGVLVDTAEYHFLAWRRLARQLGFDLTRQDNERLKGVSRSESLKILLGSGGIYLEPTQEETLADQKNEWYVEYVSGLKPSDLLPGARELLEVLRDGQVKIALASASRNAQRVIARLELKSLFDVIVDGAAGLPAKPSAGLFLECARLLGVAPERCVVFEDAVAGILAAHAAGMYAVGVGSPGVLVMADMTIGRIEDFDAFVLFGLRRGRQQAD